MKRGRLLNQASWSVPPPGKRPPRPHALQIGLRLLWGISLLVGAAPPALVWLARDYQPAWGTLPHAALRVSEQLLATGAVAPLLPIATALSALAVGEWALQIGLRWTHHRMVLRRAEAAEHRLVYRVRVPRVAPTPGQRQTTAPSADLFRAISAVIPRRGQRIGRAPYVAFALLGEPDQATTLQYVVAGGTAAQRMHLADVLRTTIIGQRPHALVEQVIDPLQDAIASVEAPTWVVGRTFRLALPPHYPLRFADDTEQTDVLGPLLVAVQPGAGVYLAELAITLQPIGGVLASFLHRGWRGQATALRLRLQQHDEYALHDDAAAIEHKLAGAPFYATLRVVAVATDRAAAEQQVAAVAAALGAYHSRTSHLVQRWIGGSPRGSMIRPTTHGVRSPLDRRLARFFARAPQPIPAPALLLPAFLFRTPAIVSSGEVAALWHLPTPLLHDLIRHLPSRMLPAPPETFIPAHDGERLIVGHAQRTDGTWQPVGPTLTDLREILHVIAGQGAGKTRLVVNLVQQCLASGCTLMNGKGDDQGGASADVRTLLSPDDEARLVLWSPLDAEWPISANPLAGIDLAHPGMEDQVLGKVQAVFHRIDAEGMSSGPIMQMLLDMGTLLVLGGGGHPSLAHIEQALVDPHYRAQLLPKIINPKVRAFWDARRDGYTEREQQSLEALQRRFHKVLTSELVRSLVVQPQPLFDWGRAIDERWIVLVDLPHNTLGGLAGVIGMLLFGSFIWAALQRAGSARSRLNYPLFIDEVQVFLDNSDGKDFALALSQLRGFGIPTAYFHQALAQLGPYKELMQVNAGSRIIMRTKYPDSAALAREYEAWGMTASDISSLDPHQQQYAVLRINGTECGPFSMRPLPWPTARPAVAHHLAEWQSMVAAISTARARQEATLPWQHELPPDSPDRALDHLVVRLVYGRHREHHLVERCTDPQQLGDADWDVVVERWHAIRHWQRRCLLDQPDLITDRFVRQQWLSRLLVAEPRILQRIAYARTWRAAAATRAHQHRPLRTAPTDAMPIQHGAGQPHHATQPAAPAVPQPTFAAIDTPLALGDGVEDTGGVEDIGW